MPHIPTADTRSLGDISFDRALEKALRPSADYDVNRWLFVPNTYTEYRYILGTRGEDPLICIGINPSTAAPDRLDNTLKSVERIALGNGFDSFLMLNVYPQRATSPGDMDTACHEDLHRENVKALKYALSLSRRPTIWAAWGNIIEMRPYLKDCLRDMAEAAPGARWVCCGPISKKGHPHHPLYLRRDERVRGFDMAGYLSGFKWGVGSGEWGVDG